MKQFITIVVLTVLASASFAGQDESQRLVTQRLQQQKMQLAAAAKAQGAERDKLLQAHMKMMQETMGKMQAMKPREGMTPQEQKEWMDEHQKLMEQMMEQMMEEHHIMMQGR